MSDDEHEDPDADGEPEKDEAGRAKTRRSSKDAPMGGSTTTEEQLTADNEAEEDTLRAIDGDSPSG